MNNAIKKEIVTTATLAEVDELNALAEKRWAKRLRLDKSLTRSLVSFQANKKRAVYRWFKYKEGFSAALVESLLMRMNLKRGVLLDPFAGSGTAMFAAGSVGMGGEGIELLPIGQVIIKTKEALDSTNGVAVKALKKWKEKTPWRKLKRGKTFTELRITKGAYPPETQKAIECFLAACEDEREEIKTVLVFALLCILESISYTRKDGQYLRWDHRSGRRQGAKIFDKGKILSFEDAMDSKLAEMITDLEGDSGEGELFPEPKLNGKIELRGGSCLDLLPKLRAASYECILTSPPYCNRYDYTRTYALELALLGTDEDGIKQLRQEMLSCTVENRAKDLLAINPKWDKAIRAADENALLQALLSYLDGLKISGEINNTGIPRMVRGYFYEMACVIADCSRVLKKGAPLIMVNDNVRYAGACVSVDLILSEIAGELGLRTEEILVLPNGKGNSSQQMGAHGRDALRKCVYIWRKE
jgi:DNA modification methylase